jgi:hypothetical protein
MPLISTETAPRRPSPKETIPYTSAAMRQDLERLRGIWEDCQASRDRNAIYGYLSAVYNLVAARRRAGCIRAHFCRREGRSVHTQ